LHLVAEQLSASRTDGMGNTFPAGSWISGMVETTDNFWFRYGFVEARIKNPHGKGLWSALWMCQKSNPLVWPPEVDIMEVQQHDGVNSRNGTNVFWGNGDNAYSENILSNPDGWNTYGLLWTAGELRWYVNGVEVRRFTDGTKVPHAAMYLLVNLAVGGLPEYGGTPDASTPNPAEVQVDYVRTWTAP
jgi:beta-glucanase (GH16 family)